MINKVYKYTVPTSERISIVADDNIGWYVRFRS